jgi:hypothetical protein
MIVVKVFSQRHEAEMFQELLRREGIASVVDCDDAGGLRPHLSLGTGNVRLLVQEKDLESAKVLIGPLTD